MSKPSESVHDRFTKSDKIVLVAQLCPWGTVMPSGHTNPIRAMVRSQHSTLCKFSATSLSPPLLRQHGYIGPT